MAGQVGRLFYCRQSDATSRTRIDGVKDLRHGRASPGCLAKAPLLEGCGQFGERNMKVRGTLLVTYLLICELSACGNPTPAPIGEHPSSPTLPPEQSPAWQIVITAGNTELGGLTLDGHGHIYAAETFNGAIAEFSLDGALDRRWAVSGQPTEVPRMALDQQRNVYVTEDGTSNQVEKFSSEGRLIATFGGTGGQPNQFGWPVGIAVDSKGNIFVADWINYRIQALSQSGSALGIWGSQGAARGQFNKPFDLALDANGDVYVSETDPNNRVQEFSPSGGPIMVWGGGKLSSEPGKFNEPRSLTTDGQGNLYVLDAGNNRIQEFSPGGRLLALWSGPTANFFRDSSAMAMDPNRNVYVSAGGAIIKTCLSSSGCS